MMTIDACAAGELRLRLALVIESGLMGTLPGWVSPSFAGPVELGEVGGVGDTGEGEAGEVYAVKMYWTICSFRQSRD